ncbi:cysteine proteinase [Massarina eburnea CBS 473.64]|uniref:Ubiquitin carboxyl-terminal hydrolase n=1 Tax=Massarina eburnea CBS 473.64 TaxID=1395130 RepID=A0A6A6S2X8_9PLEO|nr:cysteine proteinase [Massarina eburnea CBS 473.64]
MARISAANNTNKSARKLSGSSADDPIEIPSGPGPACTDKSSGKSPVADGAQKEGKTTPSPKRALSESAEEQSVTKKSKAPTATAVDKENWQGYCEIECDPAYFNVILRDIGVQGVTVKEVAMLDPDVLKYIPSPVFGLVMLFRHREFDNENQTDSCPSDVWFANQMPAQNSCATLAMIHTLLNVASTAEIDVGEYMRQFKAFTQDLTPYQRGEAFASWSFVKKIHNSFAKKMDILENDRIVAHKAKKASRSKAQKEKTAQAAEPKPKPKVNKTNKSGTARADSEGESDESNGSTVSIQDNAHHYIAFVPVNGEVWKLDGMDKQPTRMGNYDVDAPETWIHAISDRVTGLMAAASADDNDYNMFAISQSPIVTLKAKFCTANATMKAVEKKLSSINTDWRSFVVDGEINEPPSPSFFEGMTPEVRASHPPPESVLKEIEEEDMSDLFERHKSLVDEQYKIAEQLLTEEAEVDKDNEKAAARRWDYGPVIKLWMEMLAANGHLEQNLHLFQQ